MRTIEAIEASSPDRDRVIPCPVCSASSDTASVIDGWGTWQRCSECTLSFANPLALPQEPTKLFDRAYRGLEPASGFPEFAHRVQQREALIVEPELWFWSPAFASIIEWLGRRVPPNGTVLEIGCGLGFFLHALRRRGYEPVGVDVAELAVDLNRRDGFRVWHGTVASVPTDWVAPAAIVAMFMLHHLEDPIGTLRAIRQRWPSAPLAIAQYGPTNRYEHSSMPPRNLTQWNAGSLEAALVRAGYRATVWDMASNGMEGSAIRAARQLAFSQLIRFPRLYRLGKRTADRVLRIVVRPRPAAGFVLLALAEPDPDAAPPA